MSENAVKYKFNENYDVKQRKYKENVIGFNKTIIKYQLVYFIKEQYKKTVTEMTNTKNSEGLSGIDKMEMNLKKINEGYVIASEINAEQVLEYIFNSINLPVTEEEIDYQIKNQKLSNIQIWLIRNYLVSLFGSFADTLEIGRRDFYKLIILIKKQLISDEGYSIDKVHPGKCALAYIISGNLENALNNRIIRNAKYNSMVDINDDYQWLMNKRYKYMKELKPDEIKVVASTFVNTTFTYVTYEDQEYTGKEIKYDDYLVSKEILQFIKCI